MTGTQKTGLIRDEMSDRIIDAAEEIAIESGTEDLTVRKILRSLGITNRVFYNRFHNIGEVLERVYEKTVLKARNCIMARSDAKNDFFENVYDLVSEIISLSYESRKQMSGFVFETDSIETENRQWWTSEIKKMIDYAIEKDYIKNVDSDVLSYSIWCFCRGYNADVIARNIPKEEAMANFRYSFSFMIEGLKNTNLKRT
ncbi:MAG: TetR/AcrR family transcriptional regulator [Clostridia bacterium]|nr:TetR/AcrR family transcriptional regulator [Clostridia bacterium]